MNAKVRYRSWYKGINTPPRKVKLEIPGWGGQNHNHDSGNKPQPWHCPPFVDGSTYGLELLYPFETECHVYWDGGVLKFDGDFSKEEKECGISLPPFVSFAPHHFGFTSSLDIFTDDDHVLRLEPHPRFYVDITGTVPLAITGHLQSWWPRIFFVVFKSPYKDQRYIFREGEPYAQLLVVPRRMSYDVREMDEDEKKKRARRDQKISEMSNTIADNVWRSDKGYQFNDKYKVLSRIWSEHGEAGVDKFLSELTENQKKTMIRKLIRPNETNKTEKPS